jgi:hypothetical protein
MGALIVVVVVIGHLTRILILITFGIGKKETVQLDS